MTYKSEIRDGYHVAYVRDEDSGPPWNWHDLHGPVCLRSHNDPKTRHDLCDTHRYDFDGAVKKALEEWGATSQEDAEKMAEADFKRLKAWIDDDWWYCGIIVSKLIEAEGEVFQSAKQTASLWEIESDSDPDYFNEVIGDLISQIAQNKQGATDENQRPYS